MSNKNILEEFADFIKTSEMSVTVQPPAGAASVPVNQPRVNDQSPLSADVNPPTTANNSTLKNHTSNAPLKSMKNFSAHIA